MCHFFFGKSELEKEMSPSAPPWSQAAERAREPVASSVRRCHAHLLKVTFSIINKNSMKCAIKKAQAASSTAANLYLQTGASLVIGTPSEGCLTSPHPVHLFRDSKQCEHMRQGGCTFPPGGASLIHSDSGLRSDFYQQVNTDWT